MKKATVTSLLMPVAVCALVGTWAQQAGAQATKSPIVWPAGDIKWVDNPAVKGAKIAVLWGDPKTGAYGALKTIPDGGSLPLHTHTNDQRVIALAGTLVLAIDGAASKDIPPGSFAFIPGGKKHTANCKAGAECKYFEEQPGASDIMFVTGAKP